MDAQSDLVSRSVRLWFVPVGHDSHPIGYIGVCVRRDTCELNSFVPKITCHSSPHFTQQDSRQGAWSQELNGVAPARAAISKVSCFRQLSNCSKPRSLATSSSPTVALFHIASYSHYCPTIMYTSYFTLLSSDKEKQYHGASLPRYLHISPVVSIHAFQYHPATYVPESHILCAISPARDTA